MSTNDLTWYTELCAAVARSPHQPYETVSIASSSPIGTWYCPLCHQTYLALREHPYICTGGFESANWQPNFSSRASNLEELRQIGRYSKETGSQEALAYHDQWLRQSVESQ